MGLPPFLTGLFKAKPKDIELSNETGVRDPRLPATTPEETWRMQQNAALTGLRGVK